MAERRREKTLLLFLFLYMASCEETHTIVSGSAGSTFYLTGPKGCLYKNNMTYELQHEQEVSGWYDDDKLTIFRKFEGRLEFDKQTCSYILRNATSKDSGMYTITGRYMENDQTKTPKLIYNVTVIDYVTSISFPFHVVTSQGVPNLTDLDVTSSSFPTQGQTNLTACNEGFLPAACISLAPLLNFILAYLLPRGVSFLCGRIFRTQDRTQDRTKDRNQDIQTFCLLISGFVSLACQIVSLSLWLVCGVLNNSVWFALAVSCTAILCADYIHSLCKIVKSDCFGDRVKLPFLIFFILQLGFPACVVFAFYPTHCVIFGRKIWAFFIFAVAYLVTFSLPCLVYIAYCYCCQSTTEEADDTEMEQMDPSKNGSSIEKTEKRPPSPV